MDIIRRTGSLSVLNGDLGRKNRRDLPSWTPDWSATYDDIDGTQILDWTHPTNDIETAIRLATNRRRFFITGNGYIGLGPASVCVSDHLFVLPGGQAPFILRSPSLNTRSPHVTVVEDCYAHVLMDGEAFKLILFADDETATRRELRRRYKESVYSLRAALKPWPEYVENGGLGFTKGLKDAEIELVEQIKTLYALPEQEERELMAKELSRIKIDLDSRQRMEQEEIGPAIHESERQLFNIINRLDIERDTYYEARGFKWFETLNLT